MHVKSYTAPNYPQTPRRRLCQCLPRLLSLFLLAVQIPSPIDSSSADIGRKKVKGEKEKEETIVRSRSDNPAEPAYTLLGVDVVKRCRSETCPSPQSHSAQNTRASLLFLFSFLAGWPPIFQRECDSKSFPSVQRQADDFPAYPVSQISGLQVSISPPSQPHATTMTSS